MPTDSSPLMPTLRLQAVIQVANLQAQLAQLYWSCSVSLNISDFAQVFDFALLLWRRSAPMTSLSFPNFAHLSWLRSAFLTSLNFLDLAPLLWLRSALSTSNESSDFANSSCCYYKKFCLLTPHKWLRLL